ncbi:MAG: hypothetical protein FWG44_07890 [Oscillospiraceae bacterium]|nr:hypothetical protein [Oscillospiraceae bacterium]
MKNINITDSEKLFDAIGEIDEILIKEADTKELKKAKHIKFAWQKWAGLAAACLLITAVVIIIPRLTGGDIQELPTETEEPAEPNVIPHPEGEGARGGDGLEGFFSKYNFKFTNIPGSVSALTNDGIDGVSWGDNFWYGGRNIDEFTILNYIKEFNIQKDDLIKAFESFDYIEDYSLTKEEIDILYSNDEFLIYSYFANEFALFHNGEIYTPEWFTLHSVDEYINENLPTEKVLLTLEKYINESNQPYGKNWLEVKAEELRVYLNVPVLPSAPAFYLPLELPEPQFDSGSLPKLDSSMEFGAMGFEGYMAYDISELYSNNPWFADCGLTEMPVFRNALGPFFRERPVNGLSAEEMIAKAEETAAVLGLEVVSVYTDPTQEAIDHLMEKLEAVGGASEEDIAYNTAAYRASATCSDDVKIEISSDQKINLRITENTAYLINELYKLGGISITVWIEPGIKLPEQYKIAHYDIPEEQANETTRYLLSAYGGFAGIQEPELKNSRRDYNIYGERSNDYAVFENSGDLLTRILNYNFNSISFSPDDSDTLWLIGNTRTDLSDLIGYYPIITAEEAREKLLAGDYITTVPYDFDGAESVQHVELIYRRGSRDEILMPYYRFLVEYSTEWLERPEGLRGFGAYYIPAVHGDYLENLSVWDGGFN